MTEKEFCRRAAALRWLLTDVDGVLTDGRLHFSAQGEVHKLFHVRDGLAFKMARRAGLKVGLLSARAGGDTAAGDAVRARAAELKLDKVLVGRERKLEALEELLLDEGLAAREVAYVGDDLPDLPVLRRCGLSFCPADAAPEVRERVHQVLAQPGGTGALREAVERLLRARGQWDEAVAPYLE